ncbi:hypothetical protein [Lacinutrix chionoecetis]
MKILNIFIILLSIVGCNTNKNINTNAKIAASSNLCPEDGVCTFEVLRNKNFRIKSDEFGNSYSELSEGNKTVLKFEYSRNVPDNLQDASYNEFVYLEVDEDVKNLELKNLGLQKVNLGFGRICFCRGQTGYYNITQGNLNLTKINNEEYHLILDFKTDEVPQIITSINETFKL